MGLRDTYITAFIALLLTPVVLFCFSVGYAQVMQSTNYRIQSDSINVGGGLSSSTNYALESTAGESGTGDLDSASYGIGAGYQQMVNAFISITGAAPVIMSPSIVGIGGGESNGSTTVTVITDSPSGYQLTISAEGSPALVSGVNSIADYIPEGNPDYTFTTTSYDAHFGYSPSGIDIVTRFKDDGISGCNTEGIDTPLVCWDGLNTTPESIAQRASANTPDGSTTTIYFRVGVGNSVVQPPGIYVATTTLTALPL